MLGIFTVSTCKMEELKHRVNSSAVGRASLKKLPSKMFSIRPGVFWQFNVVFNFEPFLRHFWPKIAEFFQTRSEKIKVCESDLVEF